MRIQLIWSVACISGGSWCPSHQEGRSTFVYVIERLNRRAGSGVVSAVPLPRFTLLPPRRSSMRTLAIGDIHGCQRSLVALVTAAGLDLARGWLSGAARVVVVCAHSH